VGFLRRWQGENGKQLTEFNDQKAIGIVRSLSIFSANNHLSAV
jgi:hypothetical protein